MPEVFRPALFAIVTIDLCRSSFLIMIHPSEIYVSIKIRSRIPRASCRSDKGRLQKVPRLRQSSYVSARRHFEGTGGRKKKCGPNHTQQTSETTGGLNLDR